MATLKPFDGTNREPKTYWEIRAWMNAVALEQVIHVLQSELAQSTSEQLIAIYQDWIESIVALDDEWEGKEQEATND